MWKMWGLWKDMKCKQCGKTIDSFDYDWNGGVCDKCKTRRTVKFALILGLIGLITSVFFAHIQYGYELDRCSNLKSTESEYGFTHLIETNAKYTSHCYYLRNNPLAVPSYYIGGGLLGTMLFVVIGVTIGSHTKPF